MSEKIKKFARYCGTSLLSTFFDLVFFKIVLILFEKINLYPAVFYATIVARILSCILDYFLNSRLVFKVKGDKGKQFIKHTVVMAAQMLLSATFLTLIDNALRANEIIEKCFVDTALFFFAYFLQKLWVYKKD